MFKGICPKRYMQGGINKRVCSGECFGGMSKEYFQTGGCMPKGYVQEIMFGNITREYVQGNM